MAQIKDKNTTYKSIREFEDKFFPKLSLLKKDKASPNFQKIAERLAEDSLSNIKKK